MVSGVRRTKGPYYLHDVQMRFSYIIIIIRYW